MVTVIGAAGFVLLLAGYGLNTLGRIDRKGLPYGALNMVGASILAWYALVQDAPVLTALEGTWALLAVITTLSHMRRRRRLLASGQPEKTL